MDVSHVPFKYSSHQTPKVLESMARVTLSVKQSIHGWELIEIRELNRVIRAIPLGTDDGVKFEAEIRLQQNERSKL